MPIVASMRSSNWPLRPTKGLPTRSSSAPGASPISMSGAAGLPSANTVLVAVWRRRAAIEARDRLLELAGSPRVRRGFGPTRGRIALQRRDGRIMGRGGAGKEARLSGGGRVGARSRRPAADDRSGRRRSPRPRP